MSVAANRKRIRDSKSMPDGYITFRVTESHRQKINNLADQQGISRSMLIRDLIEKLPQIEKSGN